MENKKINKKIVVIILLAVIGILLIGLGIYLVFIKKNDNVNSNKNNIVDEEKNNNSNNNENETKDDESILEVYESSDKKYKLIIIDKNNKDEYNKAKKEFSGESNNDNSDITYGYLNNEVIRINDVVKEDDTYAIVRGEYLPSVIDGMCGSTITIMYNKKTKELEIPIDAEDKFYLCVYDISFEKINDKYYFLYYYVDGGPYDGVAIYTDKWIKLGYVKKNNIKSDNDGIYVYENKNLTGDLIKYDNNGDRITNDNNQVVTEKYKAEDFDEMINDLKKESLHVNYEITDDKLPKELEIGFMEYHVVLSNDGKVSVNKNGEAAVLLSNISDAKNIDFSNYGTFRLFILLNNGDVYVYELYDFDNNKYTATKINEIRNATKFVNISVDTCINCGGCYAIGIFDKNDKYIELDSICA